MKNKIIILLLLCLMLIPISTKAASYKTLNLDEALTEEDIDHDFKKYKETDDQITIYLFRGRGCGFCRNFLTYLNSIIPSYGKYFKVVSYEVWYDTNNDALLDQVSSYMNQPATGVPYIIIGDKVFAGYDSSYNEDIQDAIKTLYKSKDRYDVFEEMKNNPVANTNTNTNTDSNGSSVATTFANVSSESRTSNVVSILLNLLFVTVSTIIIVAYNYTQNKKMDYRLKQIEKSLKVNK